MSEFIPIEEHFGEGIAKPIRFFRKLGQLGLRLLNPYYPPITVEPTSKQRLHQFFEEARLEQDALDFDMGDDLFMRHYTRGQGDDFFLRQEDES